MASLQARHTRACATGRPWTPFAAAVDGCTCAGGPTYYVTVREGRKLHRERVGKNRKTAEQALRKTGSAVDEGAWRPIDDVRFEVWGERWLAQLERKPNTIYSYRQTIAFAREVFGSKVVRRLGPDDVAAFSAHLRKRRVGRSDRTMTDSTRAKHLRVLGACLESAVKRGYASRNPVRELPDGERPRKRHREAAYFTNAELPRLFAELRDAGPYRILFELALKTGMRQGELLALTWGDVDLLEGVLHVRRTFTDGHLNAPKNHEKREVYVTPEVVERLGGWWAECGRPVDDVLVLPGETKSGYLNPQVVLRRELYPAMERAGVPRVGPTGEKRTFHSLRHTFARLAIEHGRPIYWLSKHLGHSSLDVTDRVYGHMEAATRQREAREMAGVFGV